MINNVLLNIIWSCHLLVVCLVVGVPFFGSNYFLLLHAILVPFIMFHWYVNDNTCALSLMELHLRKNMGQTNVDQKDCFTCQLINPIYDFRANYSDWTITIYSITTFLWIISLSKLYYGFYSGNINSLEDILIK